MERISPSQPLITVISSDSNPLGKKFPKDVKYQPGLLTRGEFRVCPIVDMKSLYETISNLTPQEVLSLGVPKNGLLNGSITSKHNKKDNDITRSKDDIVWNPEGMSFLLIDIDFGDTPNLVLNTAKEVLEFLIGLDKEINKCGVLILPSSSQKFDPSKKSWHCYLKVSNANEETVKLYAKTLQSLCWINEHGHINLSKTGKLLVRQVFDKAVFSPERLIIESCFSDNLDVKFHEVNPLIQEGEARDLIGSDYMPKLESDFELSDKLIAQAKNRKLPESRKLKKELKNKIVEVEIKNGKSKSEALKIALDSIERHTLNPSQIIKFDDGKEVEAGIIKSNPKLYASNYVADPFSIEDGTLKAYLLPDGNIYSHKHGGYIINLTTSPQYVIDRIIDLNVQNKFEADTLKVEFETILSGIENLGKSDLKNISNQLQSKNIINKEDELNIKVNSLYELASSGKPLSTDTNLQRLLNKYGFEFHYDMIKKETVILHPEIKRNTDNEQGKALSSIISYAERDGLRKDIIDHLDPILINDYAINPLKDMVEEAVIQYDGKDYIQQFVNCLDVDCSMEYKYEIVKLWLIQCVASWFHDGKRCPVKNAYMKFEQVLLIQGEQGLSKTKLFSKLLDFKGFNKYFKSGAKLNLNDKDTIIQSVGYGIVELGEIDATFKKSDIAELKAFLSNTEDEVRLPYGRVSSKYKRRTSFCASVNEVSFLVDQTGNRRFLILAPKGINFSEIEKLDFFQLWGQVGTMYKEGVKWWLDRDNVKDKLILDELESFHSEHIKTTMIDDIVNDIVLGIEELKNQPSNSLKNTSTISIAPSAILVTKGIFKPSRNEIAELKSKMIQNGFTFNKAGRVRIPNVIGYCQ